jgi:hypothetical protein
VPSPGAVARPAALLAGGAVVAVAASLLGRVGEAAAIPGPGGTVALAVAAFLGLGGTFLAVRTLRHARAAPVPRGVFVLPLHVVDTRGPRLRVFPLVELADVRFVHRRRDGFYAGTRVELAFPAETFRFTVAPREEAERRLEALAAARAHAAAPPRPDDEAFGGFALTEAFARLNADSPPSPGPAAREAPLGAAWWSPPHRLVAAGMAAAAGLAAAGTLALDEAAWRTLLTRPTVAEAQRYAAHGRLHRARLLDEVLPRAEVDAAVAARSVAALRTLRQRLPVDRWKPEIDAAIHQLYAAAAARFEAAAHPDDDAAVPFVTRLLAWGEAHDDPTVLVRYVPPGTEMLADFDAELAKDHDRIGTLTLVPVAPHFAAAPAERREREVTERLAKAFARVFTADILTLRHGGRVDRAALDVPTAQPVIDVRYYLAPSGRLFTVAGEERAYVGVLLEFIVTLRIPGDAEPLLFTFEVEPPRQFDVQDPSFRDEKANDRTVYETMADHAYARIGDRLYATFFGPLPEAAPAGSADDPADDPADDAADDPADDAAPRPIE